MEIVFVLPGLNTAVCSNGNDTVFCRAEKGNSLREVFRGIGKIVAPADIRNDVIPFTLDIASECSVTIKIRNLYGKRRSTDLMSLTI